MTDSTLRGKTHALVYYDANVFLTESEICTCLTSLEDDAYEPGGPMSGKPRPPLCTIHLNQDGKLKIRNPSGGPIKN